MRPVLVVPDDERTQFAAEDRLALRNQDLAGTLVLDGSDEALDHGDASMLPDGAEP